MRIRGKTLLLVALLGAGAAARAAEPLPLLTWEGQTMGTTYLVKIAGVAPDEARVAELRAAVEARFEALMQQMSNYRPDSELSRFNASAATEPFAVSAEFARVVRQALDLSRDSDGAFDPTVGPVVDLWGFGAPGRRADLPTDAEVEAARALCGAAPLQVTPAGALQKDLPGLRLDLGGIAKGYGADVAAQELRDRGYSNIFVSVCGEIVAFGTNPDGQPWRVGVERPIQDLPRGADHIAVVPLSGRALPAPASAVACVGGRPGAVGPVAALPIPGSSPGRNATIRKASASPPTTEPARNTRPLCARFIDSWFP